MAKGLKTGGRQLGTPNKKTAIGERVAEFVESEMDALPEYVSTMSKRQSRVFCKATTLLYSKVCC